MSNKNLGIILLSSVLTFGVAPSAFSQTSPEKSTKPATTQKQDTGSKSDKMKKEMTPSQDEIRKAQQSLKDKGMYDGAVDGTMNAQFEKSLSDYQTKNKLKATGKLDHETMMKLGASKTDKGTTPKKGQKQGAVQSNDSVREVQTALLGKGINPGPIDGIMGPQTKKAITAFQRQENLFVSGRLDPKTEAALGVGSTDTGVEREKPSTQPAPDYNNKLDQPATPAPKPDPDDHSNDIGLSGEAQHNQSDMGLGTASSVDDVRRVQMALKNRGYDPGEINGMISSDTQAALRKFQEANNLPVTGILDDRTQAALGVTVKGTNNPDFHPAPQPEGSLNSTPRDTDMAEANPQYEVTPTETHRQKPQDSHTSNKPMTASSGKMDKDLHKRAMKAAEVLQMSMSASDRRIPDALMARAEAVAVIPDMKKAGFGIGGSFGKGLLSRRMSDGRWSAPVYVSIGGGSFGAQIGISSTELVLVFTDKGALDMVENGKSLKLGVDAGVVAGPVGRQGEAGVTADLKSGIYAYSRSKGLFAGVALDGSVIDLDEDANRAAYGSNIDAKTITSSAALTSNVNGRPFVDALDRLAAKKISEQ